jgi:hypothetical protein
MGPGQNQSVGTRQLEKHYAPWVKSRQDRLDDLVIAAWKSPKAYLTGPNAGSGSQNSVESVTLLKTDHHRVRAHQMLDESFAEAHLLHPIHAIRARIVEAARSFNQHVQAHHETEGVL